MRSDRLRSSPWAVGLVLTALAPLVYVALAFGCMSIFVRSRSTFSENTTEFVWWPISRRTVADDALSMDWNRLDPEGVRRDGVYSERPRASLFSSLQKHR